jgi:hypothetical protein
VKKGKEKKKKTKHTNDVVAIASEIYEIDRGGAVVVVLELCNSEPFSSLFLSGGMFLRFPFSIISLLCISISILYLSFHAFYRSIYVSFYLYIYLCILISIVSIHSSLKHGYSKIHVVPVPGTRWYLLFSFF